jgi:serine/threonine-protein kinase HipA
MSSEHTPNRAYVWTWLPGSTEPVVAGRLDAVGDLIAFVYGRSYLEREDAVPLYLPELPLQRGRIEPRGELSVAGVIDDAGPDAWGQRVVMRHLLGRVSDDSDPADLSPLTYLLESGSDRIGALDFQESSETYEARNGGSVSLEEMMEAASSVDRGEPLAPGLDMALLHGSSVGGARPKALIADGSRKLIAKFSSATDTYEVVKGEFVAMELGRRSGLNVASVELREVLGKDVLLVGRFDRVPADGGIARRAVVSALTMLELDPMRGARYATYYELARLIRERFSEPRDSLRELFSRITFNVLVGNIDDHARNHAALWDGSSDTLSLTPAYDVCPQPRSGLTARQIMAFAPGPSELQGVRDSQLELVVKAANHYLVSEADAREIIDHQVETIAAEWNVVADLARLSEVQRDFFRRRQFLNPYAFEGYSRPSPW